MPQNPQDLLDPRYFELVGSGMPPQQQMILPGPHDINPAQLVPGSFYTNPQQRAPWDPRGWSQDTQNILLGGGIAGLGDWMQSKWQGGQNDANRALQEKALAQALQLALMQEKTQRDQMGLQATQMDPLAQQKSRQGNALTAALMAGGPPQFSFGETNGVPIGQFTRPDLTSAQSFFTPEARAAAEGAFFKEVGRVSPGAVAPELGAVGYGGAGAGQDPGVAQSSRISIQDDAVRRQAMMAALQGGGGGAPGAPQGIAPPQKSGSGFWGKLKTGLSMAAPFALMAIPGLQGAGALAMAGRMGASAGLGALSGGKKGALMGALSGGVGEGMSRVMPRGRR